MELFVVAALVLGVCGTFCAAARLCAVCAGVSGLCCTGMTGAALGATPNPSLVVCVLFVWASAARAHIANIAQTHAMAAAL